jgi:large subunit ribosomal protein L10
MASTKNKERFAELQTILADHSNFIISTYSGLSVADMTVLRRKVRAKSGRLKVVKNNLFRLALSGSDQHSGKVQDLEGSLHGAIAVTFGRENDFPALSKVLTDAAKEQPKVEIKQGFLSGESLSAAQVKQMANLPSREELLAIIARGMNAPAQKIATGINQIISSLARGIKAVGEKNG